MKADDFRRMYTSVNESKKLFFNINGGFPRCMFFNLQQISPSKAQMNEKVCFYTVVAQFFHLNFVRILKELLERDSWNEFDKEKKIFV